MSVDILTLKQKQYISLPGEHKHLEIKCKDQITAEMANIYIIYYLQKQEPYFRHSTEMPHKCETNIYCTKIYGNNVEYLVYANVARYYPNNWIEYGTNYSWLMAYELCEKNELDLLYFMSRNELDEFTSVLRRADMLPLLEAVFIGLQFNERKVGLFKLFKD